jgi:hypothetical protein
MCGIFFFWLLVRTLELLVEICANGQEQLRLPPSATFTTELVLHTKIYVLQLQWLIVYDGLSPDRAIFSGNSLSNKKLHLLYDSGHYIVITNLKGAMAKKYICNACDTLYDLNTSVLRLAPYVQRHHTTNDRLKYCATCNRCLSEKWFQNHFTQSERQANLSMESSMPKL